MRSLNQTIIIILIACFLPYIFAFIARKTSGYTVSQNDNPRAYLSKSEGLAARANAAQHNSFEGLPLFLAAMLMADYLVVPEFTVLLLGWAYIIFRLIYGCCYLADWSRLRSMAWLLATACPVCLLVLCMRYF